MRLAYLLIAACGVANFLTVIVGKLAPNILIPLLFGFLFFVLILAIPVTLLLGVFSWRKLSHWWMGPAALTIVICLAIPICGRLGAWSFLDNWRLQHHMAAYARIVDSIRDGTIPCRPIESDSRERDGQRDVSRPFIDRDVANLPPHTRSIRAECCSDGSVRVLFLDEGSSFAGHAGCLYKDYPATSSCAADFAKREKTWQLRQITGNWYRFAD
jgi:hypothetical protein